MNHTRKIRNSGTIDRPATYCKFAQDVSMAV
jgi:hypothetical protein